MILRIYLAAVLVSIASHSALAGKRIALLIGNQSYTREVGPLKNPLNDVKLIEASLRQIGFAKEDIKILPNGKRRDILRAVDDYARALRKAGPDAIGFFYYSGHGAASRQDKRNYLIPVEVKRLDSNVWYDAVPLDRIVTTLSTLAGNAAHFVVFDACRNLLNMPTRGGKGFVAVRAKRGMLIAFSTDPGETASDEGRDSGPYAAALAAELTKPGLDHLNLFQNVKEAVYRRTGSQITWERNGLLQRVYLAGLDGPQTPRRQKQHWALLVGLNEYPKLSGIGHKGGEQDVNDMTWLLTKKFGYSAQNITKVVGPAATKANVLRELDKLLNRSSPGDEAVILLAGISARRKELADSRNKFGSPALKGETFFIPFDGDLKKPAVTLISDKEVTYYISRLNSARVKIIAIVDSEQGMITERFSNLTVYSPHKSYDLPRTLNGSKAYRGLFTSLIVEALSGNADANSDGLVTHRELSAFIDNAYFGNTPVKIPFGYTRGIYGKRELIFQGSKRQLDREVVSKAR